MTGGGVNNIAVFTFIQNRPQTNPKLFTICLYSLAVLCDSTCLNGIRLLLLWR